MMRLIIAVKGGSPVIQSVSYIGPVPRVGETIKIEEQGATEYTVTNVTYIFALDKSPVVSITTERTA